MFRNQAHHLEDVFEIYLEYTRRKSGDNPTFLLHADPTGDPVLHCAQYFDDLLVLRIAPIIV